MNVVRQNRFAERKKMAKVLQNPENSYTFAVTKPHGSLDEWLSQRSAKPCTAVRIRQEPQRKEVWVSG